MEIFDWLFEGILILFVVVLVFLLITRNKIKERAKREAERLVAKRIQLNLLSKKKKEEDKALSVEKKVKCDDGFTRIYNGFMYGIIRENVDEGSISVKEIRANDGHKRHSSHIYVHYFNELFNLEISNQKWFSDDGVTLNSSEILIKNEHYFILKNFDETRIEDIKTWKMQKEPLVYKESKRIPRSSLCCINNIYFHTTFLKNPCELFSGTIDGTEYLNGVSKKNNTYDSVSRVNWDDTEDVGIITHYKGKPFTGICYGLYDNGNLEDEYEMLDGLKHGKAVLYYDNGQIKSESNWKDDKQEGLTKDFHENGEKIEQEDRKTLDLSGFYEGNDEFKDSIEPEENIQNNNLVSELQNDFPVKKAIENYFIERPNIARIFDELNMFLYKGFSAEKYLIETGIINSDDTRRIVSQGFYDISLYLETLEKDVNTLNRRDLSISEEFKKRYGKEVPEGSGIDSILFALHPEIKTSLKQAIEMLNKDGDIEPPSSKSNKLEKEIDDFYQLTEQNITIYKDGKEIGSGFLCFSIFE
ncbi:MAG: toxin-antitoxin system YwqK family antitoxin, partial [Flavobacteriales bacterium]